MTVAILLLIALACAEAVWIYALREDLKYEKAAHASTRKLKAMWRVRAAMMGWGRNPIPAEAEQWVEHLKDAA